VVSGRVSLESQDTVVPGLVAADTDELIWLMFCKVIGADNDWSCDPFKDFYISGKILKRNELSLGKFLILYQFR
jgi:hypothetical protein